MKGKTQGNPSSVMVELDRVPLQVFLVVVVVVVVSSSLGGSVLDEGGRGGIGIQE